MSRTYWYHNGTNFERTRPWGQVVFAPLMMSLIFSAGVCPFKTRRGRRLRRSWTAWAWASVTSVKLVPLGKYSRISPPVFSLVGR